MGEILTHKCCAHIIVPLRLPIIVFIERGCYAAEVHCLKLSVPYQKVLSLILETNNNKVAWSSEIIGRVNCDNVIVGIHLMLKLKTRKYCHWSWHSSQWKHCKSVFQGILLCCCNHQIHLPIQYGSMWTYWRFQIKCSNDLAQKKMNLRWLSLRFF